MSAFYSAGGDADERSSGLQTVSVIRVGPQVERQVSNSNSIGRGGRRSRTSSVTHSPNKVKSPGVRGMIKKKFTREDAVDIVSDGQDFASVYDDNQYPLESSFEGPTPVDELLKGITNVEERSIPADLSAELGLSNSHLEEASQQDESHQQDDSHQQDESQQQDESHQQEESQQEPVTGEEEPDGTPADRDEEQSDQEEIVQEESECSPIQPLGPLDGTVTRFPENVQCKEATLIDDVRQTPVKNTPTPKQKSKTSSNKTSSCMKQLPAFPSDNRMNSPGKISPGKIQHSPGKTRNNPEKIRYDLSEEPALSNLHASEDALVDQITRKMQAPLFEKNLEGRFADGQSHMDFLQETVDKIITVQSQISDDNSTLQAALKTGNYPNPAMGNTTGNHSTTQENSTAHESSSGESKSSSNNEDVPEITQVELAEPAVQSSDASNNTQLRGQQGVYSGEFGPQGSVPALKNGGLKNNAIKNIHSQRARSEGKISKMTQGVLNATSPRGEKSPQRYVYPRWRGAPQPARESQPLSARGEQKVASYKFQGSTMQNVQASANTQNGSDTTDTIVCPFEEHVITTKDLQRNFDDNVQTHSPQEQPQASLLPPKERLSGTSSARFLSPRPAGGINKTRNSGTGFPSRTGATNNQGTFNNGFSNSSSNTAIRQTSPRPATFKSNSSVNSLRTQSPTKQQTPRRAATPRFERNGSRPPSRGSLGSNFSGIWEDVSSHLGLSTHTGQVMQSSVSSAAMLNRSDSQCPSVSDANSVYNSSTRPLKSNTPYNPYFNHPNVHFSDTLRDRNRSTPRRNFIAPELSDPQFKDRRPRFDTTAVHHKKSIFTPIETATAAASKVTGSDVSTRNLNKSVKQLASDVHMALVEDHGTLEIAAVHAAMQLQLIDGKALEKYMIRKRDEMDDGSLEWQESALNSLLNGEKIAEDDTEPLWMLQEKVSKTLPTIRFSTQNFEECILDVFKLNDIVNRRTCRRIFNLLDREMSGRRGYIELSMLSAFTPETVLDSQCDRKFYRRSRNLTIQYDDHQPSKTEICPAEGRLRGSKRPQHSKNFSEKWQATECPTTGEGVSRFTHDTFSKLLRGPPESKKVQQPPPAATHVQTHFADENFGSHPLSVIDEVDDETYSPSQFFNPMAQIQTQIQQQQQKQQEIIDQNLTDSLNNGYNPNPNPVEQRAGQEQNEPYKADSKPSTASDSENHSPTRMVQSREHAMPQQLSQKNLVAQQNALAQRSLMTQQQLPRPEVFHLPEQFQPPTRSQVQQNMQGSQHTTPIQNNTPNPMQNMYNQMGMQNQMQNTGMQNEIPTQDVQGVRSVPHMQAPNMHFYQHQERKNLLGFNCMPNKNGPPSVSDASSVASEQVSNPVSRASLGHVQYSARGQLGQQQSMSHMQNGNGMGNPMHPSMGHPIVNPPMQTPIVNPPMGNNGMQNVMGNNLAPICLGNNMRSNTTDSKGTTPQSARRQTPQSQVAMNTPQMQTPMSGVILPSPNLASLSNNPNSRPTSRASLQPLRPIQPVTQFIGFPPAQPRQPPPPPLFQRPSITQPQIQGTFGYPKIMQEDEEKSNC